jgi:MFS family permease
MIRARLGPLIEPNFRRLFIGQATSSFGDRLVPIALAFAVLDLTGSATDLGLVVASKTVPTLLLVGYAGVWADRLPRQLVMLTSDSVRAVSQGLAAALLLSQHVQIWELCALQAVYGSANAFFQPAVGGLVPTIVAKEGRRQANALMSLSGNITGVAGPAIGGTLVALANPGFALAIDAGTFVVSALSLSRMRIPREARPVRAPIWTEFREGLEEVRSRSWLSVMLVYYGLVQLTVWPALFVLGPYVAKKSLSGATSWAVIATAGAIGSLLGAAIALRRGAVRPLWVSRRLMVFTSVPIFLLAIHAPTLAIATAMLLAFAGIAWSETLWETLLQHHIPERALSRVTALDWTATLTLNPIGFALIGPVAAALGTRATLLAIGAFAVLLPLSTLAFPGIRNVRLDQPIRDDETAPEPVPV